MEAKVVEPMYHMYELLCRLLNETNLLDNGEKNLEVMVGTVTSLQDSITSQMALNQQEIRGIIMSVVPQLTGTLGSHMTQEVDSMLATMSGLLD